MASAKLSSANSNASIDSTVSDNGKHELSDDIGNLVGDCSDMNSDDSGNWMQKIDVSNFKHLTGAVEQLPPVRVPAGAIVDHGHYAAAPGATSRQSGNQDMILKSFPPSPDSNPPPMKKERTSCGSLDSPHDYAADTAASIENAIATSTTGKIYPKPIYSYSCLIALALKNSQLGRLTVSEIYNFMCENFPYFRNAPAGWKNSVRHNLSLNKCFEKIEIETPGGHGRKSCLWTLHEGKKAKMDQEIKKWREKDPEGVRESLLNPNELEVIEKGLKGMPGDVPPFLVHSLPDVIQSHHQALQSQLLLVRSAAPYLSHRTIDGELTATHPQAWSSYGGASSPSIPPRQPETPPKVHSTNQDFTGCSPHVITSPANFSTPVTHRQMSLQQPPQQSSPFTHTPPYSPNVHSPQLKLACHDWPSSLSRTEHADNVHMPSAVSYSPFNPAKITAVADQMQEAPSPVHFFQSVPLGNYNSPCKAGTSVVGLGSVGPYETASNALNNNSLLQTALAQSPCSIGHSVVTLQSL